MSTRSFPVLVTFLALLGGGCASDSKGEWCSFLDQGFDDGESYCPDPDAPEACEDISDQVVEKADTCAQGVGLELTDEQRDDVADALDCDSAKAIGLDEEDCKDDLDDAPCNEDGLFDLPESCKGVVKTW